MLEKSFTLFKDMGLPGGYFINPGFLPVGDRYLITTCGFLDPLHSGYCFLDKTYTHLECNSLDIPIPYRFDQRLFNYDNKIKSLTTHVTIEPDGLTKIQNCWLESFDFLGEQLVLADATCISRDTISGWSDYVKAKETKNFLPFVVDNKILYIHSICPLVVCELDADGNSKLVAKHDYTLPIQAEYFGGNTVPVKLSDTELLIGFHYKQAHPEYNKWYYCNAFLVIDINTYKPLAYTDNYTDIETYWSLHQMQIKPETPRQYAYDYFGVVFPCGIIDMGEVFRLSCGIFDAQGAFIDISKDSIKTNLKTIDN